MTFTQKPRLILASIGAGLLSIAGFALVQPAATVHAAPPAASTCGKSASIVEFPPWYAGICNSDGSIKSPTEVGGIGKFLTIIVMNIVTMILMAVGYVSLAMIIWGGFQYMISGDNANGTAAARKTIQNAVIGLIISIMSVAIVKVIAGSIV